MADQNKDDAGPKFYTEVLSPSELFSARTRSHKIPVRGQKDFYPDDSEEQRKRLEQSLNEHWGLVSEERVERLGNLVKAVWIPSEQLVELQSPAGKFWQTMGFSASGKQYLLPEEALYLMECGSIQVFYQDLPLSIQDGFEWFLSSSTVSLQQYQVFGHLKRLGYVVHRFDASSEPSPYARQLNLSQSRGGRTLKRKRSDSPVATCSRSDAQEVSAVKRKEAEEALTLPESQLTSSPVTSGAESVPADPSGGRSWWITDPLASHEADKHGCRSSSRWDGSIVFPNVASVRGHSSCLASPDPSLLPGGLTVGECDIGLWTRRINQREVKMSPKERERERKNRRRSCDVNRDKKVRQCKNWPEYHRLLASRRGRCSGRPEHLWKREITPLHDHTQPISTGELLKKISVIESTHLLEGASRLNASNVWRICFSVYQPDTVANFKKSNPGKPFARMCVCSFSGPVPDLAAIKQLSFQSGDVQVVFAVVDAGDISFYTFKDFQLPTDVYP
ncbi:tRNA-splicing endonuclease subunit Sen54 isoform X1 [Phycodurus eques]|uniref:tRNA-splicing endonuclease subunit Sen54 isoform X1 n=1 Tax=Phycodurus eques TaxID=693459 RepID=UPI002ACECE46|nr:tRNA-splicing endonuclease subunit Sen54 isoform X1 [Phycodurus eques]XP_061557145.1 tRNA-splicing endonuclease subunit Sen54 isoform X1 [Phycodurus eques]